jgi:hypothetical protein
LALPTGVYVGQPQYAVGARVRIMIHNGGIRRIWLVNIPPWKITLQGKKVYPGLVAHSVLLLGPNRSKIYFWNQRDLHNRQVPHGRYVVRWGRHRANFGI